MSLVLLVSLKDTMYTSECKSGHYYPSVNVINSICNVQLDKLSLIASEVSPTKLEVNSTEEYKYGGAPLHLYSLTQVVLSEREK